jgi:hypothetical protein
MNTSRGEVQRLDSQAIYQSPCMSSISSFGRLDVDQNHVLSYTTLAEGLAVGGVVIDDVDFRRLTRTGPVARRCKRDSAEETRKYAVLDREQFREVCGTVRSLSDPRSL